ncbi:15,15' beta carotene dioxygenase [Fulvivirga imtechensis AK7]|uniref:15,15' beta carotene dioxygenase n=1 Tax=Fulvivirga imtechensis AK7 TaxID=1237149 RepID=L8JSD9_9BACT|nr:carotenoid oxygenase family protein [Fulvivirga imtechensis]ELR71891.1 15,15' beta carotene dioxygenase [Fulvivirga imtechensis AK7]
MSKAEYSIGFQSQENEIVHNELPVQGAWPEWLSGSLLRTAPSKFEVGNSRYRHWFDGLAMLHKFTFSRTNVSYACKLLESRAYKKAVEKNRIIYGEFGTDPCLDLFGKVFSFFSGPDPTDNGSININLCGESLVAVTETPKPVAIGMDDLRTIGPVGIKGNVRGHLTVVHPHYDREGTLFSFITKFGPASKYKVYSQQLNSRERRLVGTVTTDKPAYMHSFGMTERYIILTEFPLVTNVLKLRFGGRSFIENYKWQKERGTRIHLIDKKNGAIKSFDTTSFFAFHHVNAFEQEDDVVFDIVAYKDATVIDELYLDHLRSGERLSATTELWRYRLNTAEKTVSRTVITRVPIELPRINYWQVSGRVYQYVYGVGTTVRGNFIDNISKVNVSNGHVVIWREAHCYPGEPVFVARPNAKNEDDGILLSIVLNTNTKTSFLLILDAKNLRELARVLVPQHITFGFHGQYIDSKEPEEIIKTIHS